MEGTLGISRQPIRHRDRQDRICRKQNVSDIRGLHVLGRRYILVTANIDGDDSLQSEIPFQLRDNKWSDEASTCSINVNWGVEAPLDQQIIDGLDILILASVGGTENDTDTNGVLIDKIHGLLGVNDISGRSTVDIFLLDLEVSGCLLPANLDCGGHDDVRVLGRLSGGLAGLLPALLHGKNREHDGLGGTDGRGTNGVFILGSGCVEETGNHGDASVLDISALGVFFVIDEVLGESLGHEGLSLLLLLIVSSGQRCRKGTC